MSPSRRRTRHSDGDDANPQALGEALAKVSEELGLAPPGVVTALMSHWPEVVGTEIAEHARLVRLRGGVLTVAVDAAPWATELRYLTAELETRVAAIIGPGVVREFRIVVAPWGPEKRE